MFNRKKFRGQVIEKGFTLDEIANKIGVNPATLYRKMSGESDFSRKEIQDISAVLRLSDEDIMLIFFADELT